MINKEQPLWWTITKMIIALPGGLLCLFLAGLFTWDMFVSEYFDWLGLAFILLFFLLGGYLMTVLVLSIITIIRQNKEA